MSVPLEPREILSYLNELGYTNITAQQLKAFIKDLKKLIKYEQRSLQKTKPPILSDICNLDRFVKVDSYIYSSTNTDLPEPKNVRTKENIITVEVKRVKRDKLAVQDSCEQSEKASTTKKFVSETEEEKTKEDTSSNNNKAIKSKSSGKLSSKSKESKVTLKPKASFIRPKVPLKTSKSDPVTLYHQYQAEWKKIRFPGEDNRPELRWAVRAKMMGDTRCRRTLSTAPSLEVFGRKK